jgi:hypothetical protein
MIPGCSIQRQALGRNNKVNALTLVKQAALFSIKVAMHQDISADDLDFLDDHQKGYIRMLGKDVNSPYNPPPFVPKQDKAKWQRAKKIVKKHWKRYKDPYAIVTFLYHDQFGGRIKKRKSK